MDIETGNTSIGEALGNALSGWEYTLPLEYVRKGQAYVGSSTKLRRVLSDLMNGGWGCLPLLGASAACCLVRRDITRQQAVLVELYTHTELYKSAFRTHSHRGLYT